MLGLYIHIPFCKSRCIYCNFYSTTKGAEQRSAYVEALIAEWLHINQRPQTENPKDCRPSYLRQTPISSIYFGGGTPSSLTTDEVRHIMASIRQSHAIAPDAEVTFEANPDDITPKRVEELALCGINRISLGIQSFDDKMLCLLNRRHDGNRARQAIADIHAGGIHNISGDLIYGLPRQDLEDWHRELGTMLEQDITHLSAYALTYEEGTPLYNMRTQGIITEVDEETSLAMYEYLLQTTDECGMRHYEISNFAKPGYEARHNSSYWHGAPYIGLGAGAHSFDGDKRRWINSPNLDAYLSAHKAADKSFVPPHEEEVLCDTERYNEIVMTGLRTAEGVCLDDVALFREHLIAAAAPFVRSHQIELTATHLRLTKAGIFVSDYITTELMLDIT